MKPKDLPTSIINIQNTPTAPDPTGMQHIATLLGTQGLFKDMTGLDGTQKIALEGMLGNQQAALGYAGMASKLAALGNTEKLMEAIKKSGLPLDKQGALIEKLLGNAADFNGLGKNGSGWDNMMPDIIKGANARGKTPSKFTSFNPQTGESHQSKDRIGTQIRRIEPISADFFNNFCH